MTDDALSLRSPLVTQITKPQRIEPRKAIAFALSIAFPGNQFGPRSKEVKLVLDALRFTDHKIVPR